MLEAYQIGFEESQEPILGFIHDDCVCMERGWDERVLREFDDPHVGLVGFGGALGFCDPELYRKPYELPQLARHHFRSNLREAEVHGERFTGECDVVILDGFALFVRRQLLEETGGWPIDTPISYYMYDAFICCEAMRHHWKIRLVGVACDHLERRSAGMGQDGQFDYEGSHWWIYLHYRDVLPAEVK